MALVLASLGWLAAGSIAWADDPTCPASGGWLDGHAHLRAISLDLRGVVPSPQDYARLERGEVPEALVDEWLASPEFASRAVRHHRALLWNNVSNLTLLTTNSYLSFNNDIYWRRNLGDDYRGVTEQQCGTFEATLDGHGRPVPQVQPDGSLLEGYRWVAPYWNPSTPIKVCAYDAQETAVTSRGVGCDTLMGQSDPECGCGPDLRWCAISSQHLPVHQAIAGDVDRRVETMIREDRSYLELFTGNTGFVNGPLVYFLKNQSQLPGGVRLSELPVDLDALPDLDFTDASTWVEVDLGDHHAGLLTSPAWLLRFSTNRARANRYYNSFLCQPFQPPEGGIPEAASSVPTLDLTARDGCKYCHALLEPTAAYWGRWTPGGAGYLPEDQYPAYSPECVACANGTATCSDACSKFYLTRVLSSEQAPYVGELSAYEFLDDRHASHVDLGPELLVEQTVADGRLPTCVARSTASWLLGRDPSVDEEAWVEALAGGLVSTDWSYRALVKQVVLSDAYRTVGGGQ
jgi:hypothetical protein